MARIKIVSNSNRKEIILKNAAALFRKRGFKAASVRELAERLDIEAPSLYNHFRSKAELLKKICFSIMVDFTRNIETVASSDTGSVQKIEMLIRFHIQKMHTDFDFVYVANHEWKHLPKDDLELFLAQRKEYERRMIEIVAQGMDKKEIRKSHPQITVLTILSAVRGLEFWQRHKKELSITELENNMLHHLINGIIK